MRVRDAVFVCDSKSLPKDDETKAVAEVRSLLSARERR